MKRGENRVISSKGEMRKYSMKKLKEKIVREN